MTLRLNPNIPIGLTEARGETRRSTGKMTSLKNGIFQMPSRISKRPEPTDTGATASLLPQDTGFLPRLESV